MRSWIHAIAIVALTAASAVAQLLGDPNAKPDDKPADQPVPGRPPAAADRAPAGNRPEDRSARAASTNAMFAVLDSDGDGVISKVELRKAIKALKTLDTDNDGSITLAEASVGGGPAVSGSPPGEDPRIARLMANDGNGDGKLTANEVPNEMLPMLQGVDQNNDRAIDRGELQAAFTMQNRPGGPWRGPGGPPLGAENEATGQFLQFDRNRDGRLSNDEVPPQAGRWLQGADGNNDGAIDVGEFQAAVAKQGGKARALRGGIDPENARGRKNFARDGNATAGKN